MRRLIGIAVSIGFLATCDNSYAGDPRYVGNVWHPAHRGFDVAVQAPYFQNPVPHWHRHHQSWLGIQQPDHRLILFHPGWESYARPHASTYTNALDAWDQHSSATSQPAINWQMIAGMAIQNQLDAIKARDEARRSNTAWYRSRQVERLLAARAAAKKNYNLARPALLRLSPDGIDRHTGRISWPGALQGAAFDAARRGLEQLVAAGQSASRDSVMSGSREIHELVGEIKKQLKAQIREMPPKEYIAAHKFLDGLANELRSGDIKLDMVADSRSNR